MITFPLSLSADWQSTSQVCGLSSAEQEWLFEPHSLTAKLKSQSQRFAVKVLSEQKVNLSQPQQALLSNAVNTVLNREVLLLCDDKPVVYAQSWLQYQTTIQIISCIIWVNVRWVMSYFKTLR